MWKLVSASARGARASPAWRLTSQAAALRLVRGLPGRISVRRLASSPKKKARKKQRVVEAQEDRDRQLTVALVGRPNVGKSTLFNRLTGTRAAIVSKQAGTTRDWKEGEGQLGGTRFRVLDTGGLEIADSIAPGETQEFVGADGRPLTSKQQRRDGTDGSIERRMLELTGRAIRNADLVFFIVDCRAGISPEDELFARWLRRHRNPGARTVLLANKAEWCFSAKPDDELNWMEAEAECYRLGLGHPLPISAEHNDGMADLYEEVLEAAESVAEEGEDKAEQLAAQVRDQQQVAAADEEEGGLFVDAEALQGAPAAGSDLGSEDRDHLEGLLAHVREELGLEGAEIEVGDEARHLSGPSERRALRTAGMELADGLNLGDREEDRSAAAQRRRRREQGAVTLAVVGRPNAGKSTLVNRLLQQDRVLTGPVPGVTRDATEIEWSHNGREIRLVDTAGMSKWGVWDPAANIESVAAMQSKRTIGKAHVAALVIDADQGLTHQDMAIARSIVDEGRGLVLVVNKTDLFGPAGRDRALQLRHEAERVIDAAKGLQTVSMSAYFGDGINQLMPAVMACYDAWNRRIPTGTLNRWFSRLCLLHPPPAAVRKVPLRKRPGRGKHTGSLVRSVPLRIKFISQTGTRPPTFALFANRSEVPEPYVRFLVNCIREEFGIWGVPVRLMVRSSKNPYRPKDK